MIKIPKELFEALRKHKHLFKYAKQFCKYHRATDGKGHYTSLIVWFRDRFDAAGINDVAEYLDWDDEMAEDFYSWGSNSRWGHVFSPWLYDNTDEALSIALNLADEFGDVDVVKKYPIKENL